MKRAIRAVSAAVPEPSFIFWDCRGVSQGTSICEPIVKRGVRIGKKTVRGEEEDKRYGHKTVRLKQDVSSFLISSPTTYPESPTSPSEIPWSVETGDGVFWTNPVPDINPALLLHADYTTSRKDIPASPPGLILQVFTLVRGGQTCRLSNYLS
jgi:hypothetical protein